MRRILLGIVIGILVFTGGAFGAAAKDAVFGTVTAASFQNQPGGNAELGVLGVKGNGSTDVVGINGVDYVQLFYSPAQFLNVSTGTIDPTAVPCKPARAGSLYLRHVDSTSGQAWVKTGADADSCAWTNLTP
jgi:hypothetical protein